MQAMYMLVIVMFIMSLVTGFMTSGSMSAAQVRDERIVATQVFFEQVKNVLLNDITQAYLTGNPNGYTAPAELIRNTTALASMSEGRSTDAGVDAWGTPYYGRIYTDYQYLVNDSQNKVLVPVTVYALVSAGPDRTLQTRLPDEPTTFMAVQGIVPPSDANGKPSSDDIVLVFDNFTVQKKRLESMKDLMQRIGTAALVKYQQELSDHRRKALEEYQQTLDSGSSAEMPDLYSGADPTAPAMEPLNTEAQRVKIGVNEYFESLEKALPGGGKMVITTSAPATAADPMVIYLNNSSTKTPWGTSATPLQYSVKVTADQVKI